MVVAVVVAMSVMGAAAAAAAAAAQLQGMRCGCLKSGIDCWAVIF